MIRIGIDVGGTNTDAVVMDGARVVAGVKRATTADVMGGVVDALEEALKASGTNACDVDAVMIGTTHFTNAVVQRRDLAPTAAIMNLELDTGEPITTEMLCYGQRVAVIGMPVHELMRTPKALEVVGPQAFGYPELMYAPLVRDAR